MVSNSSPSSPRLAHTKFPMPCLAPRITTGALVACQTSSHSVTHLTSALSSAPSSSHSTKRPGQVCTFAVANSALRRPSATLKHVKSYSEESPLRLRRQNWPMLTISKTLFKSRKSRRLPHPHHPRNRRRRSEGTRGTYIK